MNKRGVSYNLKNRFEKYHVEYDEDIEDVSPRTEIIFDNSKSVLSKNNSPDIFFDYGLNPYRGCEHGCIYCYARPTHEYLGYSSGLDFETKIVAKKDAAKLLHLEFSKTSWKPQPVCLSGITDCYQPLERKLKITRECLEVFLKFRNPVYLITKNSLIRRDIDILKELAELNLVRVNLSVTSLKREISRILEPRTSIPEKRIETIHELSSSGIPVYVNVAPIIPCLNDEEIPQILEAVSKAGAKGAGFILLRLPHSLKEIFSDWLELNFPDRKQKVLNRLKELRGGYLYKSEFGKRFSGEGVYAEMIASLFEKNLKKFGLNENNFVLSSDKFIRNPGAEQLQFL